ncbi:SecY-interacting protein [Aliiglaciecola sp. LCG003]|uniref:SecY-interacting protein n=1 Tax=Aliiglaciecola sp. LCG003 TaxID=3053655 RepID=UPI0025736E0E|nr:SecY-interacting protein [Aliiglaciecola sp. LCG003]WJG10419.1 SecY-interacting protein [Aliiglaciecola sp. LCG003]
MGIHSALDRFVTDYIQAHHDASQPMVLQFDQNWPSPCYQQQGEQDEWVPWLPVRQNQHATLTDFEQALDLKVNPQLSEYFTCYWSENLNAKTPRGNLQLLLPWNQADFERLQQNLIGHVLMKRRLKQPETLFFAVTDEDDFFISIDNASGRVMLEQVGLEPTEVLAENLVEFLQQLQPRI